MSKHNIKQLIAMKGVLPKIYLLYEWDVYLAFVVYRYGKVKIVNCDGGYRRRPWLKGRFKDLKVICEKFDDYNQYCYVLLKKKNGKGVIAELISKKIIIKDFNHSDYMDCLMNVRDYCKHIEIPVISFLNKKDKIYSLYTPSKKYVYGPYHYNEVEVFRYGVILDHRFAVCNHGYMCDLSEYTNLGVVYKDKELNEYIFFVDEDKALFRYMNQDKNDESILSVETKMHIYKYNKVTGEIMQYRYGDSSGEPLTILQARVY